MAILTSCGRRRLDLAKTLSEPLGIGRNSAFPSFGLRLKGKRVISQGRQLASMASQKPGAHTSSTSHTAVVDYPTIRVSHTVDTEPAAVSQSESVARAEIPAARRDPRRLAAFAAGLAVSAELLYTWMSGQSQLPSLQEFSFLASSAGALILVAVPSTLLLAKAIMGDLFHVELHRGRLYICAGVPSAGPPLAPGTVRVRPTGDARGNGAFAVTRIPAGTHIINYEGDLLSRAAFLARYPDGVGDYATAVDDEWVIDAASLAPDTSTFHAVHMNHSRARANVRRYYKRAEGRVSFFAARDIDAGEELLYDYGRAYWYGREHLEIP